MAAQNNNNLPPVSLALERRDGWTEEEGPYNPANPLTAPAPVVQLPAAAPAAAAAPTAANNAAANATGGGKRRKTRKHTGIVQRGGNKGKGRKTKKTKKTRKHTGIVQRGGNKGKLRKGYKYTGKKLKNGLPQIVKCKSKKC